MSTTQDPATAIPKGTLMAIFCTTLSYLGICTTIGGSSRRVSGTKQKQTFTDDIMGLTPPRP